MGLVNNGDELVNLCGTEHGDARLAEVGNALEDGTGSQVSAGVQYATIFVNALHVDAQLLLQHVNLFV